MAEAVVLPGKIHNERIIKDYEERTVWLNGYKLNFEDLVPEVYKYELKFQAHLPARDDRAEKYKDLWVGPKNDVALQLRKGINYQLFVKLLDLDDIFGEWDTSGLSWRGHGFVYDCATVLYSRAKLLGDIPKEKPKKKDGDGGAETPKMTFHLAKDSVEDYLLTYVNYPSLDGFMATLSGGEIIDLSSLKTGSPNRGDRSALQFLELLYTQRVYEMNSHFVFKDRMFRHNDFKSLEPHDPRILIGGNSKSVRTVGNDVTDCKVLIQVEPKKAAFFPGTSLIEYAERYLTHMDRGRPVDLGQLSDVQREMLTKHLRGIVLVTTHLLKNVAFQCCGVSKETPSEITFLLNGKETNVREYFDNYHMCKLKFPSYPCAIQQKNKTQSSYPFEVLSVHAGQRVPLPKQTPKLTELLIKECQLRLPAFRDRMAEEKDRALISDANPYARVFGVRVGREPEATKSKILHPPKIVTYSLNEEPSIMRPTWRMQGHTFLKPVKITRWTCIAVESDISGSNMDIFLNAFVQCARDFGIKMNIPSRCDILGRTVNLIMDAFFYLRDHDVEYVLLITRDNLSVDVHNTLKSLEQRFSIPTQHINTKVLKTFRTQKTTLYNIVMKLNMKLGGVNWTLSSKSGEFTKKNGQYDMLVNEYLHQGRMFFGIDFSHAAPQSLYDRNTNVPISEPTVVGMACTLGQPLKMHGTYWYQEPLVNEALNMKKYIIEYIRRFKSSAGRWPSSVVVYRNGASEGDFDKAVAEESKAFDAAFVDLRCDGLDPKPSLIIVVVQKTNIARILTNNPPSTPYQENAPAGTVVDEDLLDPSLTEFYIIAHKTIQGTARPARCTVVHDTHKPRVRLQDLEYITYSMCYTHGVVCSPISVPGPLYSASDLAKRGRNNLKTRREHEVFYNNLLHRKMNIYNKREKETEEDFYDRINDRLHVALQHKFWA